MTSLSQNVFILGAPRSGTTFLASLLGETRFGPPYETHFIPKYYDCLDTFGDLNDFNNFHKLVSQILQERSMMQFNADLDISKAFTQLSPNITYRDLVNYICLQPNLNKGLHAWGDKTPWYTLRLDVLVDLFPDAKFIYIYRDGRDVALSLLQKPWGPNNIYSCAQLWHDYSTAHRELFESLENENKLLTIPYENILNDAQKAIHKIYQFLGCEISTDEINALQRTTKTNNAFKWKSVLTAKQRAVFESVAGTELKKHGYEVNNTNTRLLPFESSFYLLHEQICKWIFLFNHNIIDGIKIKFFGKKPFNE